MDSDKLNSYIKKYHSTVFRAAYGYVKSHEDAEDIVQETFFRLYIAEKEFLSDENVKAWLIRVSINLAKDMLKSSRMRQRTELAEDIPCHINYKDELIEIIGRLKAEYCVVLLLFYYEEYSVKEIAEITQCSQTLVTTRLSRARKQLKKILLKEGYDEKIY
ncbi:MAG: RNA polymerase sigma factor [Oscillospiraceae bacterium]|nr:RNA polymerase sigma factor [Oscillospiraceae bacterium]